MTAAAPCLLPAIGPRGCVDVCAEYGGGGGDEQEAERSSAVWAYSGINRDPREPGILVRAARLTLQNVGLAEGGSLDG